MKILKYRCFISFFRRMEKLEEYDSVLLNANLTAPQLSNTIYNLNPKIKIIVYCWNCIALDVNPEAFNRKHCELWSFDPEDCDKYNMNYNPPCAIYFGDSVIAELKCNKNQNDFLYGKR